MTANAPIRDAATVLLLRDRPGGSFEVFMVRRTGKAAFMANAMVFPGGRLDEADCDDGLAARCALNRADAAARLGMDDGARALGLLVAAVRETFEEAGVLLARRADGRPLDFDDPGEAARFARHRDALNAGTVTLAEIAATEDLTLAVDALAFHAHWITPEIERRRYDTRFLVTRAPAGQRPLHEGNEATDSAWLSPAEALEGYEAGRLQLAPPTLRVLLELAALPDTEAALRARADDPPRPILPVAHFEDGRLSLLLPGDEHYPPGGPAGARNRIVAADGRWLSEGGG